MAKTTTMSGVCPKCNSDEWEYEDTNICGDELGYEFECKQCGARGTEWYHLTYVETVIDED